MKILFIASESYPFIKTGGLGEVLEALPKELSKFGYDIRVVLPKYRNIDNYLIDKLEYIGSFNVRVGWRNQYCGIFKYIHGCVTYYLLDNEYYFNRDLIYGYYDDGEKFAFFDRAALEMLEEIAWKPDIIHCNDWQTGMVPVLYNCEYKDKEFYKNIKNVFSVHNLFFKGVFSSEVLPELFGYDYELYHNGSLKFGDGISYLKGGLNYSDKIITVSKSYSEEIQRREYGEGLQEFIRSKRDRLVGIVNGIDYDEYNPSNDKYIYCNYSVNGLRKKQINKEELQNELGLPKRKNTPVIAIISRLTDQKGCNLVIDIIDKLLQKDIQFVILGTGDENYEEAFKRIRGFYSDKVYVNTNFDNKLAHKIYAGSDIFLMPSLFEPCGLGQLIALRYGTVPVVREIGGLRDTIVPYNKYSNIGNGFGFTNYNSQELLNSIESAIEYYYNKDVWNNIVSQGMEVDNSWKKSAIEYKKIYEELIY